MSETNKFRGIWIPEHIWNNAELTWGMKLIIAYVDSLAGNDGCYATNEHLAKFFGKSESRIADMLTELRGMGYIIHLKSDGRRRWIKANMNPQIEPAVAGNLTSCFQEPTLPESKKSEPVSVYSDNKEDNKGGDSIQKKTTKRKGITVEIPTELQTPEFIAAWQEWAQHRLELKKPMTPLAARKQLGGLVEMGVPRAIAAINHSIARGWQGIFEPNEQQAGGKNVKPTVNDPFRNM